MPASRTRGDWDHIHPVYPIIKAMNPLVFEGRKSTTPPPAGRHPGKRQRDYYCRWEVGLTNDIANHPDGPHTNEIENSKEQKDSGYSHSIWESKTKVLNTRQFSVLRSKTLKRMQTNQYEDIE